MNYLKIIIYPILLFLPINAIAEPSSKINYLMNDPLTIFDIGMIRLNQTLTEIKIAEAPNLNLKASYDWNKNRINIHGDNKIGFGLMIEKFPTTHGKAKKLCTLIINAIRTKLSINEKGQSSFRVFGAEYSMLSTFFSRTGFVKKSRPDGIDRELDNISIVSASVDINDNNDKSVICNVPLLGKQIFFSK